MFELRVIAERLYCDDDDATITLVGPDGWTCKRHWSGQCGVGPTALGARLGGRLLLESGRSSSRAASALGDAALLNHTGIGLTLFAAMQARWPAGKSRWRQLGCCWGCGSRQTSWRKRRASTHFLTGGRFWQTLARRRGRPT
eukprot:8999951-Pyramimonas_sp.AAC.1